MRTLSMLNKLSKNRPPPFPLQFKLQAKRPFIVPYTYSFRINELKKMDWIKNAKCKENQEIVYKIKVL